MKYNKYYVEQYDSTDCGTASLAIICKLNIKHNPEIYSKNYLDDVYKK